MQAGSNSSKVLDSSFRDPNGFLFEKEGELFRHVSPMYKDDYLALMQSGLYDELVSKQMLVPHTEVESFSKNGAFCILQPERIPFISYPYEWSFSQLKDAALLTLDIQKAALRHNMSLKDGSAYNVQFFKGKPIFIDTLSFERYADGKPWVAYRQFCRHFYAPLVLAAHVDIRSFSLLRTHIDGIPLDWASAMLPAKSHFNLAIKMHIHMHAKAEQKYSDKTIKTEPNVKKQQLLAIIDSLETSIRKLHWQPEGTEWADYYNHTNYTDAAQQHKAELVESFIKKISPQSVWDLGANNGRFSRIAASRGCQTIAFDIDPSAVEKNYLQLEQDENLLPLVLDLTNPSPGIGWSNTERMSINERGPADVVMALALIHHLAISNNVPFQRIARYFAELGRYLIIEFVPKSDSQVRKLLRTRVDIFDSYTGENFEIQFGKYFRVLDKISIQKTKRTLYFMRLK